MSRDKVYRAIGLMSGTSADGVDAALLETDGKAYVKPIAALAMPYEAELREKIRDCFGLREKGHAAAAEAERQMTYFTARVVVELLAKAGLEASAVDVIGFHGQTLTHDPAIKMTWQIGDGGLLARQTGIDTVNDFRSADVAAGGQGAPFLPLYHAARAGAEHLVAAAGGSIAILNVGGVANVTYIGEREDELLAFDTGPGNALMDDLIYTQTGKPYDKGGEQAARGQVHKAIVENWTALPYFALPAPKSLDRNAWDMTALEYLSLPDALATLAEFTAQSIAISEQMLPEKPALWMVTGGGRHNAHLMGLLEQKLKGAVRSVDEYGWDGDCVEAEGFAYLAVRSLLGLPLSLPGTTGVPEPLTGGVLHKAA